MYTLSTILKYGLYRDYNPWLPTNHQEVSLVENSARVLAVAIASQLCLVAKHREDVTATNLSQNLH